MAFRAMLILCASVLLTTTRVSSYYEHERIQQKDQSERQSLFSMWLYRKRPEAPELSPAPAPLDQPITPLPMSPLPVSCAQATPPVSRQYSQSLFSMWLYPNIPTAPGPSSSPPSLPITTLPGSSSPDTCAKETPPTTPSTPTVKTSRDCVPLCGERCRVEPNKKICRRMCIKCCSRCKCVPPGDFGANRDACGKCYTDIDNRGYKCP